jgi:hypothetical protein
LCRRFNYYIDQYYKYHNGCANQYIDQYNKYHNG